MVLWCFQAAMDLFQLLQSFVMEFVARHGALLQALWLDEITLKAIGGRSPSPLTVGGFKYVLYYQNISEYYHLLSLLSEPPAKLPAIGTTKWTGIGFGHFANMRWANGTFPNFLMSLLRAQSFRDCSSYRRYRFRAIISVGSKGATKSLP